MRSEIINKVMDIAGLGPNDDESLSKDTLPSRMKRDSRDLENIRNSICEMINPFDPTINPNVLFNIKTGRKASTDAERYLLSVFTDGEEKRDQFIEECSEDKTRFEKSIKKSKIVNFATENFINKNKSKKAVEIAQVKGTRDVFARLLYLSIAEKGLGEETVLSYPLTPEPAEFVHPDGTIRQTTKSAIAKSLNIVTDAPKSVENIIIDGMFFLRNSLTLPLPHTMRGLVRHILIKVLKLASNRVDLVLNTYKSPCLKDIARDIRGDDLDDSDEVYNFGGGQKTPTNFLSLLKYSNFKKEFLNFLSEEIKKDEYAGILENKVLYCSVDNACVKLQCVNGVMQVEEVHELFGDHDEADTRVGFHALHVDRENQGNTVIRCNDTDVLIIMLCNIHKFSNNEIWLDLGTDYNNSRHYVHVRRTAENMKHFISALPGIYNFSGNDYIPCFYKKGKTRPLELMLKSDENIHVFSKMGDEQLTDEDIDILEAFTCSLFGYKKLKSIDEARYLHFKNKSKPKESRKPLDFLKHVDPSLFPPCRTVLVEQIKRTWFITRLYKYATDAEPLAHYTLLDYGYQLQDGRIHIKWFEGLQVPLEAEDDDLDEPMDGSDVEDSDDEEVSDEEGSEDESDCDSDSDE